MTVLAPFELLVPATVEEAVELLWNRGGDCRILAGGTDLLVEMHGTFESPPCLLDIKGIEELKEFSYSPENGMVIGALVTHHRIDRSEQIRRWYPALYEGACQVGSVQIRHRGTLGGNICNAVPSADTLGPLLALDARLEIAGPGGVRAVPLGEFFLGPKKTVLQRGEILARVLLPPPAHNSGSAYIKFTRRGAMDLALLGASASIGCGENRVCSHARIGLTTAAPTPMRAMGAEAFLLGRELTAETLEQAGSLAAEEAKPRSSWRSSEEYRRDVLRVVVPRAIAAAVERARNGGGAS